MRQHRTAARPTPGQRALADALARGEAALGEGIETLAASLYTDPARFEAEQRAIFDRVPHLLAPVGAAARAQSWRSRTIIMARR